MLHQFSRYRHASISFTAAATAAMSPPDAPFEGPQPSTGVQPIPGERAGDGFVAPVPLQSVPDGSHDRDLALLRGLIAAPHAPLHFVAAQLLWVVAPLAAILGFDGIDQWAAGLERRRPDG